MMSRNVAHFSDFFQLSSGIIAAVPVSVSVRDRMRAGVVSNRMVMTEYVVRSGVVTIECSMIAAVAAGIVSQMTGCHADNHIAEAEHCADDVQSSKCS